jgi:hypothetical protein
MVAAKSEPSVMNVSRFLLATVIALDLSACDDKRSTALTAHYQPPAGGGSHGNPP